MIYPIAQLLFLLSHLLPVFGVLVVYPLYGNETIVWHTSFSEIIAFYLILFIAWLPLCFVITGFLLPKEKTTETSTHKKWSSPATLLSLAFVFIGIFLTLASISRLQLMISEDLFYLVMATLFIGGLAISLGKKGNFLPALLFLTVYHWAVGYISFTIYLGSWLWQPLLFSLGLSLSISSGWIGLLVHQWIQGGNVKLAISQQQSEKGTSKEATVQEKLMSLIRASWLRQLYKQEATERAVLTRRLLVRLIPFLVLLAPFSVASLVYIKELSTYYLLVFAVIPLTYFPLRGVEKALDSGELSKDFSLALFLFPLLFASTLLIARLL